MVVSAGRGVVGILVVSLIGEEFSSVADVVPSVVVAVDSVAVESLLD